MSGRSTKKRRVVRRSSIRVRPSGTGRERGIVTSGKSPISFRAGDPV